MLGQQILANGLDCMRALLGGVMHGSAQVGVRLVVGEIRYMWCGVAGVHALVCGEECAFPGGVAKEKGVADASIRRQIFPTAAHDGGADNLLLTILRRAIPPRQIYRSIGPRSYLHPFHARWTDDSLM